MAVERRNPLPPGVYWIDVFDPNRQAFAEWLKAFAPVVRLRATEHFGPGTSPLHAFLQGAWTVSPALAALANLVPGTEGPARDWALFEVLAPSPFDAKRFGYPTIAGAEVKSSDDTVQKPDVKPPDLASFFTTSFGQGLMGLGIAFGVIAAIKLLPRRK